MNAPEPVEYCQDCTQYYWPSKGHYCDARPVGALYTTRHWLIGLLTAIVILGVLAYATNARAREGVIHPISAPSALLKARAACPNTATLLQCRAALRRAYGSVEWQRSENLKLAREMLGKLTDWTCIHNGHKADGSIVGSGEGAWNAHTGNGYYGGLQMDATFERTYGRDMLARYHGHADRWPPREQIKVAQRAYSQNRGYNPWPNTARACGLR